MADIFNNLVNKYKGLLSGTKTLSQSVVRQMQTNNQNWLAQNPTVQKFGPPLQNPVIRQAGKDIKEGVGATLRLTPPVQLYKEYLGIKNPAYRKELPRERLTDVYKALRLPGYAVTPAFTLAGGTLNVGIKGIQNKLQGKRFIEPDSDVAFAQGMSQSAPLGPISKVNPFVARAGQLPTAGKRIVGRGVAEAGEGLVQGIIEPLAPGETRLGKIATSTGFAGLLGGLIQSGGEIAKIPSNVIRTLAKKAGVSDDIIKKFIRDETGRFAKQEYIPKKEPVMYGDLRESLGLPRNGDYIPSPGMTTRAVPGISKKLKATQVKAQSETKIQPPGVLPQKQNLQNLGQTVEGGIKISKNYKEVKLYDMPKQFKEELGSVLEERIYNNSNSIPSYQLADFMDENKVKIFEADPSVLKKSFSPNRSTSDIAVKKYAEAMKGGADFPEVFVANGQFIDGGHRVEAAIKAGRKIKVADITDVINDAIKFGEEEGYATINKDWLKIGDVPQQSPNLQPVDVTPQKPIAPGEEKINKPEQTQIRSSSPSQEIIAQAETQLEKQIPKTINIEKPRVLPESPKADEQIVALQKSPIPSQETIEKVAQIQMRQKAANNQLPQGTPTLPDIIHRSSIDVKDKVNIIDQYVRTPDRVLKKIGLEKEAILLRNKYNDYLEELPIQINRITQWSKEVSPESNQRIFQFLDGKPIQLNANEMRVAQEIRQLLREWADRLKLPQESRITNYITHIFDKDFIKKEFDPELAKLLENRVAGSVYDPFTEQRLGKLGYKEDTWAALDAYVKRATRKVHMDEALGVIKEKSKNLELSQYKYVKQYVDRINLRPTDIDNLFDNLIKSVAGYKFGVRPTTELTRKARQAVYRGTLGLNIGSAVKNLTQGANTYARLGEKYTILGYAKNIMKLASGDDELQRVGVLRDELIQDRTINATKKFWEKVDKGLFFFFETAEKINRGAAYFGAKAQALDRGMDEKQAIDYALKVVRDTQFTFGSIDTPPILASDLGKLLLQFQSFTLKQWEFLGEMVVNKDIAGLVRYGLASVLLAQTMGKLIGMDWKDFIPSLRIGLPPILQTPVEIGKAIVGAPDKYGNIPDTEQRLKNIGKTMIPFIPGGVQIKKTIEGLGDVGRGYAQTAKGNVRYPVSQDVSNAVRGGLFGPYNLPEAQANRGVKPLSEKQSDVFRESQDKQGTYQQLIQKREDTAADDKAKEELKSSGGQMLERNNKIYILQDNGDIKTINPSFQPSLPKLTGNEELDKKLISKYKGEITKKANDIVALFEAGKLDEVEAEKQLQELKKKSSVYAKPKKGKKIRLKTIKFPKLKLARVKKIKITKPKKTKQYTLKLRKIKKTKIQTSARLT